MQITEKCQNLKEKLVELEQLKRLEGQAQNLETRRQELEARRRALTSPVKSALLLKAKDIVNAESWPNQTDIHNLSPQIAALRKKLEQSPGSLTQGHAYATTLTQLDNLANSLKAMNQEAWENYVDSLAPPVPVQLLDILGQLSKYANQVRIIRQFERQISTSRSKIPLEEADITQFQTLSSSFREARNNLDLSGLPEEVVTFLEAALSPSGAALLTLTQQVIKWLTENDSLAEFRITSSRQSRVQQFR